MEQIIKSINVKSKEELKRKNFPSFGSYYKFVYDNANYRWLLFEKTTDYIQIDKIKDFGFNLHLKDVVTYSVRIINFQEFSADSININSSTADGFSLCNDFVVYILDIDALALEFLIFENFRKNKAKLLESIRAGYFDRDIKGVRNISERVLEGVFDTAGEPLMVKTF